MLRPRNPMEHRFAEAVAAVFQVDLVGIDDNFFDIGGNSLLIAELHRRLVRDLPWFALVDLYRFPNVRALAGHLTPQKPSVLGSLAAARERGLRSRGLSNPFPESVSIGGSHD
ncbi:phosphopantetheine-binding protein [Bosea vestrisii]|uniref:phosphopantetheine-binding protein n=1 Tax=Bosea vestrisii TaxID=151416 RepID=UPI003D7667B0